MSTRKVVLKCEGKNLETFRNEGGNHNFCLGSEQGSARLHSVSQRFMLGQITPDRPSEYNQFIIYSDGTHCA